MQIYPHHSAGVYSPFSQHPVRYAPVPHQSALTLGHVDNDIYERRLLSRVSPLAYNGQTEGKPKDSGATRNNGHQFDSTTEAQGFLGHGGVFPPYPTPIGPLSLDNDTRANQVVAVRETFPRDTAFLASGPPFRMGSEETARPPVWLPQSGTNNNSKEPKKQKSKAATQDEPRKAKRTEHSTPQVPNLQRGNVQVSILNSGPF